MTAQMDDWVCKQYNTALQLTDRMNEHFNTSFVEHTVCAHLNCQGSNQNSLKLMQNKPCNFNSPQRILACKQSSQAFQDNHTHLDDAIHIDEGGFNLSIHWSQRRVHSGARPIDPHLQQSANHTLFVAVGPEGVVANWLHLNQTTNGVTVEAFMQNDVLPALEGQQQVIIMDNAPVHQKKCLNAMCGAAGHRLFFLPTYSPYLNCAEWVFGSVKPFIKKQDILLTNQSLIELVEEGINPITAEAVSGWMREIMRNFHCALNGQPLGRMYDNRSYRSLAQFSTEEEDNQELSQDRGTQDA